MNLPALPPPRPISVILSVFVKELRCLTRDRQTLLSSILVPLFLYPVVLLGFLQGISYVQGVRESRTVVVELTGDAPALREELQKEEHRIELRSPPPGSGEANEDPMRLARRRIVSGDVDAVVHAHSEGANVGPSVQLYFSKAMDGSGEAKRRLEAALQGLRQSLLRSRIGDRGYDDGFLHVFDLNSEDLATSAERTNYVAGLVLPLLMIVMLALGALYPALEATVGEKERGSLETTLISPVPRSSIVVGKYLAVVTFSMVAFLLNFASMALTLSHLSLQFELSTLRLTFSTISIILACALLLAVFISGLIMTLAFLARSFKEGQTYVMPVYILATVGAVATADPDIHLDLATCWIPLVNLVLLFREALSGTLSVLPVTFAFASGAVYTAVCLWLASRMVRREGIVVGSEVSLRQALSAIFGRGRAVTERGTS